MLIYDGKELILFNSENGTVKLLKPGVYAFSNADPDTGWPKVKHAEAKLREYLARANACNFRLEELSILLSSRKTHEDQNSSEAGFPAKLEKLLSSCFVVSDQYGTRSCTAVIASGKTISAMESCYREGVLEQTNKYRYEI